MIELNWVITVKPNLKDVKPVVLNWSEEGIERFNEWVDWCHENIAPKANAQFTSSGGLKKCKATRANCYGFPRSSKTMKELIVYYDYALARIQVTKKNEKKDDGPQEYGASAFRKFRDVLKRHGIDIDEYAENDVQKALEIKETIPSPKIWMNPVFINQTLEHVHHLDLNSAYPSGMVVAYPELRPAIEEIYTKRKVDPNMKNVLNMSWGYMQSFLCKYKWSALSKAGMVWTINRLDELTKELLMSGREIVGYNTDGIWYVGPVYHDEFEGSGLGQWKTDHINCKFRAKSNGAYEFEEDGKYTPVVRGYTNLEKIKPKEMWEWGDIYGAQVMNCVFDQNTEKLIALWEQEDDIHEV